VASERYNGIRVNLEIGLGSFQSFLIIHISYLGQTRGDKKIPKTVLKTMLKTKETTYTLVFGTTLLSFSEATQ
jgi:hypothetical protein